MPLNEPYSINTFCGIVPYPHDANFCKQTNDARGCILDQMRCIVSKLDSLPTCPEWDTSNTNRSTPGPYIFNKYAPKRKPWERNRVNSIEIIAGRIATGCKCISRNGLQDECYRSMCRGRPKCMSSPFPTCPPFTQVPARVPSIKPRMPRCPDECSRH